MLGSLNINHLDFISFSSWLVDKCNLVDAILIQVRSLIVDVKIAYSEPIMLSDSILERKDIYDAN